MDNFAGTAEYYNQFRPGVPEEVVNFILQAVSQQTSLLDLGCGTGQVLEQFAPYFADVIAIEPDRDMLKLARERLQKYPVGFRHATSEDAKLPEGWTASLVTAARAFHWMDRPLILRKLEPVVAPNGVIAIFGDKSIWNLEDEWCKEAHRTVQEFIGKDRQTLSGAYHTPVRPYRDDFAESAFSLVTEHTVPVVRHWSIDQIIGYLYSTSFASKALLQGKAPRFEEHVRQRLATFSVNGDFVEHNRFDILLASRP